MGDLISEWLLLRPIFLTPRDEQTSFETNSNSQDDETWGKFNQLDELNIETSKTRRHTMLLCDETKMLTDTETFFLWRNFSILGILKDLSPGVLKSMKNSSEREIWETLERQQSNLWFLESFQIQPLDTILSEICPF